MTEARRISDLLPDSATTEMVSSATSTIASLRLADLDLKVLENLPKRLSDGLMAHLEMIVSCPLPPDVSCDDGHFAQVMRSLSILPRRADDEISGKLRTGLYERMLGGFSDEGLSYMCERVLATCTFFPSIAECLKILEKWDNRALAKQAQEKAKNALRHERQFRMEETMLSLMKGELDGDAIAALPEGIRDIALTRALIWADPDGTFRPRPDPDAAAMRERAQRNLV